MVTMRAGSAMCTELGTMRVTEQVDALETMAVNPVQYLLVPRVLAGADHGADAGDGLRPRSGMAGRLLRGGGGEGPLGGHLHRPHPAVARSRGSRRGPDQGRGVRPLRRAGRLLQGLQRVGRRQGRRQATTQAMVASALGIFILDYFVGVLLH